MHMYKLIDYITRLITDSKKIVFLIHDNLHVHHAKTVMAWLEKHNNRIELFYLLPYSPEYNPDELLNSDFKRYADAKQSLRTRSEF